jgi:hypothetical protein
MAKMADFVGYVRLLKIDEKERKYYSHWVERFSKYCKGRGMTAWEPVIGDFG